MKLKMAENSLFAILLRSRWWISAVIGACLVALAMLLHQPYRVVGAMVSLPLFVIAVIAARRQWRAPSAARVAQTLQAIGTMAWPAFADLLVQAFEADRYTVQRRAGSGPIDFELERDGRRMLASARRWKSARIGLEPLRTLQAARESAGAADALLIGIGELTDSAHAFAADHHIEVWQGSELTEALRHLPLPATKTR